MNEAKSIVDWAHDEGYEILDPDGFDRTDMEVMTRLRTKEEFDKGFMLCTVQGIGHGKPFHKCTVGCPSYSSGHSINADGNCNMGCC